MMLSAQQEQAIARARKDLAEVANRHPFPAYVTAIAAVHVKVHMMLAGNKTDALAGLKALVHGFEADIEKTFAADGSRRDGR